MTNVCNPGPIMVWPPARRLTKSAAEPVADNA
jgi:hypothetical protein